VESILRAAFIYLFLLVVLRFSGRRTLATLTTFDFVLLLILGESTQQALLGEDYSLTNAAIVILTLVGLDILFTLIKRRSPLLDRWIDSAPLLLMIDGQPIAEAMRRSRVDVQEVLAAARQTRGLERLDQIRYAILESSGKISIIPASTPNTSVSSPPDASDPQDTP